MARGRKRRRSRSKAKRNIPTNSKLYARVKAATKRKFAVYPSAYANAWVSKEYKKWLAYVTLNGKLYRAGRFEDKVEAARARDRKAIELHGEFAKLNFPIEDYK